ncbi:MAG: PQQ-like beta-propeller repeat protein [Verrucomicrobiales bacterium]|nr:PQQ-like beta-propeller repeat protein [Verrucomicrobiales bacterium]
MMIPKSSPYHAAVTAMVLIGVLTASAADWPQWRGPNRDGVWNETGIREAFPADGLPISWRIPVGRGWSSPVIADGRVYITDVEIVGNSAKERVLSFNGRSGNRVWAHSYPVAYPDWAFGPDGGGPRATPILHNGRLFTLGATGELLCLNAATGDVVWARSLMKDFGNEAFSGITSSPLIEGDLLILQIFAKPGAAVVALDKGSGREVWRALDDSFTYSSPIVFTAGGQRQLIAWTQAGVTSLDPRTGKTWWRELFHTPGDMAVSTPVFHDHRLLVAGVMFQLGSGEPLAKVSWPESKSPSKRVLSNTSTALFRDEYVYSAKITGELVCIEASTGNEVWKTNTVTAAGNGSSIHITPNGGAVLLFTDEGNLILAKLTPQGYTEVSRASLLKPTSPFGQKKCAWTPPAFANRCFYVRSDAELICVSLAATR